MTDETTSRPPGEAVHLPLSLRAHEQSVHAPAAWFIPGGSARRWAEEMSAWSVPLAGSKLYCVPMSLRDRSPCGVLVVPPTGTRPVTVRLAQPYGLFATRLFLPVSSSLHPPVAEDELRAAVPYDVAVMHPAVGLIGFGQEDVLAVSDLLRPPPPSPRRCDAADPGIAPPPRLLSVEPEEPPTVERMLDEGRDDIGSESPTELPRAPDESTLRDAAAKLIRPLSQAAQWVRSVGRRSTGAAPSGRTGGAAPPQGRGMFSAMADWFRSRAGAMSAGLESARQRELQRLLKLLASDPDAGLRHAIPLTSSYAPRGRATPGANLTPHGTDFRLGALGGGRPTDPWDVPAEVQKRLREEYRRAATRELQLGRYRRAAYVFAELLGDYGAAAAALRQGRFHREAATLYRDKLNQPHVAAQCLEEGGLLAEAAAEYGALREYEKAGDLLAKIDRLDAARERWREAVALHLTRHDRLAAARLLETKLAVPDEALAVLAAGWPSGERAADCLREHFNLLGRLGRHEDAASRVRQVARAAVPTHASTLSATLAGVAATYPSPGVREAAADTTRVVVGRHLRDAGTTETAELLKALAPLDRGDRLLTRDVERYMRQQLAAQAARTARRPPAPQASRRCNGGVVMLRSFHLGADVQWLAIAGHDAQFFAYGVDSGRGAVLVRGRWDGRMQRVVGPPGASAVPPAYLFYLPERKLLAVPSSTAATAMWYCPADGDAPAIAVGTPDFLSGEDVLAARLDQGDRVWTLEADDGVHGQAGGLSVSAYRWSTGHVLASHAVEAPPPSDGATSINARFAARGGTLAIGIGGTLFLYRADQQLGHQYEKIPLPDEVRSVVASRPMMSANLVITFADGAALVREEPPIEVTRFGDGLVDPLATHLYTGGLVLVDQAGQGRVYDVRTAGPGGPAATPTASFETASPHPIALLPGARLSEFAVVSADGLVQVFAAART